MSAELGNRVRGVSHLALNSSDMGRTVDFYTKLGIPLVKTMMVSPDHQHFFFDIGNGDYLAYFYWGDDSGDRSGAPAVVGEERYDGAMHHIAFEIDIDDVPAWWARLEELRIPFGFVAHNVDFTANVLNDLSAIDDPTTWAASFYLAGPDGEQVEFCAWLPAWDDFKIEHVGMGTTNPARRNIDRIPEMVQWTLPKVSAEA